VLQELCLQFWVDDIGIVEEKGTVVSESWCHYCTSCSPKGVRTCTHDGDQGSAGQLHLLLQYTCCPSKKSPLICCQLNTKLNKAQLVAHRRSVRKIYSYCRHSSLETPVRFTLDIPRDAELQKPSVVRIGGYYI
jgi:hypothetical protein